MFQPVFIAALGLVASMSVPTTTSESSADLRRTDHVEAVVAPAAPPCRGERLPPASRPAGADPRWPARPMWLWDTPKVLLDAEARAELLAFCACQGIDGLWMQVALERQRAADGTAVLQHAAAWRTLLREAHAAGLTVEALEGAPIYALKPHHGEALAVVDAVIAFSKAATDRDGFDGLHFDIEPHGLYRWRFPESRERMAAGLVEVSLESSKRLRAAGLRFGVALPFWMQVKDEQTGEPIGVVTLDKTRQSAAHHLIDRLDYVAIMSYRDKTAGPNGVVAIAGDLLAHAAAPGKARVYLGLETAADSERVWFVTGEARERTLAKMRARGEDPDELEPIGSFRRSIADDGTRLHLGLRVPTGTGLDAPALLGAVRELASAYGTPQTDPPGRDTAAALSLALGMLDKSGDWRGLVAAPIAGEDGLRWSGFLGVSVTPPAITFGGQPPG
ncbi:MAG: hypothetical protein ABIT71_12260, partial [Vicinamibacteraceae bacterium]